MSGMLSHAIISENSNKNFSINTDVSKFFLIDITKTL